MTKTPLLASLSAKVAAGIAGVALLAGGTGTVLALQPASDTHELPAKAADAAVEATNRTTTTTDDDTSSDALSTEDDGDDVTTESHPAGEHPDNFGALVSEDAKDGGVDGHEIADAAHARNAERRGALTAATDDDDDQNVGQTKAAEHRSERASTAGDDSDDTDTED